MPFSGISSPTEALDHAFSPQFTGSSNNTVAVLHGGFVDSAGHVLPPGHPHTKSCTHNSDTQTPLKGIRFVYRIASFDGELNRDEG